MTPLELVLELRSRINPIYAAQIGTESHERKLCADALEALLVENAALRGFAAEAIEEWATGDIDGFEMQRIAESHGMLREETRHEPCGEGCFCNEHAAPHEWESGVVCYQKTPLLTGQPGE